MYADFSRKKRFAGLRIPGQNKAEPYNGTGECALQFFDNMLKLYTREDMYTGVGKLMAAGTACK